jgi:hypothetical protein
LWELNNPRQPRNTGTLTANGSHGLLTVFYSHSGQLLAAAGRDNILRFWLPHPDNAVRAICATAGYPITPKNGPSSSPRFPTPHLFRSATAANLVNGWPDWCWERRNGHGGGDDAHLVWSRTRQE